MSVVDYIENTIDLSQTCQYAAIIGATPSQGARSPVLWNAVFEAEDIDCNMLPFDVLEHKLSNLLSSLATDETFIGGAVTMPFKEKIAQWLGDEALTEPAKNIGAVNCLFRDEQGRLKGTNTDGEAALVCVQQVFKLPQSAKIVQLGAGGAGKAVAAFLANAGYQVSLCVRQPAQVKRFAQLIGAQVLPWSECANALPTTDLLVNTTPIGFAGAQLADETPVSLELLKQMPATGAVYDVVYDPSPTRLLHEAQGLGLATEDGKAMNLEQAVLGFFYAQPQIALEAIQQTMQRKKVELDG